jgi:hypothetical protein
MYVCMGVRCRRLDPWVLPYIHLHGRYKRWFIHNTCCAMLPHIKPCDHSQCIPRHTHALSNKRSRKVTRITFSHFPYYFVLLLQTFCKCFGVFRPAISQTPHMSPCHLPSLTHRTLFVFDTPLDTPLVAVSIPVCTPTHPLIHSASLTYIHTYIHTYIRTYIHT